MQSPSIKMLNLENYAATYSLGLKVESDVNPNVSGSWVIPYHLADTFTAKPTFGVEDYVLRDSSTKYSLKLAALKTYQCPAYLARAYSEDAEAAKVSYGSFGLMDWLESTAQSANSSQVTPKLDYYTVKFAVTGIANAAPGFAIVNLSGTVNLPLKRIDTNTLNVAFVEVAETPVSKVCVTNVPGAAPCEKPAKPKKPSRAPAAVPQGVTPPPKRQAPMGPAIQQQLDRKLENLQLRDILRN